MSYFKTMTEHRMWGYYPYYRSYIVKANKLSNGILQKQSGAQLVAILLQTSLIQ